MNARRLHPSDPRAGSVGDAPAAAAPGDRPSTQEVSVDDIDLAGIYERQKSWPELLEHLLAQAEEEPQAEARAQYLTRAAEVFERHVGDAGGAFMALSQAVHLAASHARIGELERLALALHQLDMLPDLFREASTTAPTDASAAASWTALARWHRTHATWQEAAAAARNAVACAPLDEVALRELEEAERHLELWVDLTKTLKRRLNLWQPASSASPGARAAASSVWAELAAIYDERLGDAERALDACQQALVLDPQRRSVAVRMERLCEAHGRHDLALWLLDLRRQNEPPRADHAAAAVKLALSLQKSGEAARACDVLEEARAADAGNELIYDELAQAYGARGAWNEFVDTCWRHAAITQDRSVRGRLAFEAGRVLQNRLGQADAAAAAFNEALTYDPAHLNARRGLIGIHRSRADLGPLAEGLWDLAELTDDRDEKLSCFAEAAGLLRDSLNDQVRAQAVEARLLEVEPGNEHIWVRRVEQALSEDQPEEAERIAAEAFRAGAASGRVLARLGQARLESGDVGGALAAFHEADAEATAGVDWRVSWARALRLADDKPRAALVAQQLLSEPSLEPGARAAINVELGHARLPGNVPGALAAFKAALAAAPHSAPAFAGLAEAHRQQGTLHAALPWKWSAFDHAVTEEEKTEHALAIAEWVDQAGDSAGARTVLEHALTHLPRSGPLLEKLAQNHVRAQAWPELLQVLKRQAALAEGARRADLLIAAADLALDRLGDGAVASALLANALEAAPTRGDLADRLESLLNERQDFAGLEQHLRRRLARLGSAPTDTAASVATWQRLARLYEGPLANPDRAVVALQAVARLENSQAARKALATMLETRGPEGLQAALPLRHDLLREARQPRDMVEPLRALARSFGRFGDVARSLHATAAVVALGEGTAQENAMVRRQAQAPFIAPPASLLPRRFESVLAHPEQWAALSAVYAHAADAAAALHAQPARSFDLPPRWGRQEDPTLDQHPHVMRLRHIAAALGVVLPPVTVSPSFPGLMDVVVVAERRQAYFALALGQNFFAPRPDAVLAFLLARGVARLRREHLVTWPHVVPTQAELEAIVEAARLMAGVSAVLPADPRVVATYVGHLRHTLPSPAVQTLCASASSLPAAADVGVWLRGAALTMNRAGLLICNDLSAAMAHAEPDALGGIAVPASACTRDLILWSMSDEFSSLRTELLRGGRP